MDIQIKVRGLLNHTVLERPYLAALTIVQKCARKSAQKYLSECQNVYWIASLRPGRLGYLEEGRVGAHVADLEAREVDAVDVGLGGAQVVLRDASEPEIVFGISDAASIPILSGYHIRCV